MPQPTTDSAARPFAYTILAGVALGLAVAASPRTSAPKLADAPTPIAHRPQADGPTTVEVAPGAVVVLASPERTVSFDPRPLATRVVGAAERLGSGLDRLSERASLLRAGLDELAWRARVSPPLEMLRVAGRTIGTTHDRLAGSSTRTLRRLLLAGAVGIDFEAGCGDAGGAFASAGSPGRSIEPKARTWRDPIGPGEVLASPEPVVDGAGLERDQLARPRVAFPSALR